MWDFAENKKIHITTSVGGKDWSTSRRINNPQIIPQSHYWYEGESIWCQDIHFEDESNGVFWIILCYFWRFSHVLCLLGFFSLIHSNININDQDIFYLPSILKLCLSNQQLILFNLLGLNTKHGLPIFWFAYAIVNLEKLMICSPLFFYLQPLSFWRIHLQHVFLLLLCSKSIKALYYLTYVSYSLIWNVSLLKTLLVPWEPHA